MNRVYVFLVASVLCLTAVSSFAVVPDYYLGDSAVYSGSTSGGAVPNIMLVFDISKAMSSAGSATVYESDRDGDGTLDENPGYIDEYEDLSGETSAYTTGNIYYVNNGKTGNTKLTLGDLDTESYAYQALRENGVFIGKLSEKTKEQTYVVGDYACLVWELSLLARNKWVANTAYAIGDSIEVDADSDGTLDRFVCAKAGTSDATETPDWNLSGEQIIDNTVVWEPAKSALSVAASVLKLVAAELGDEVKLGVAVLNENNQGGDILQPLIQPNTDAKLTAFETSMDALAALNVAGNHWQVNEALWDVGGYFIGDLSTDYAISSKEKGSVFTDDPGAVGDNGIGTSGGSTVYLYPTEYWCQPNHIILVTSGLQDENPQTAGLVDDLVTEDAHGNVDMDGSSLDVAKHLYEKLVPANDLDMQGEPFQVRTHVIQLLSAYISQLEEVSKYGHGEYFMLENAEKLGPILGDLITRLLEADSSFVAPVVPASPENRAYSGQRIYLGFFKPMNGEPWYGNLKKFGLNLSNQITAFDENGAEVPATYSDGSEDDGYFLADADGNPTVYSHWGSSADMDGGVVELGGVGAKLKTRTTARNIYTDMDKTTTSLDAFAVSGDKPTISAVALGLDYNEDGAVDADEEGDAVDLIKFVHGYDAYGEDPTAKRSWFMGDIMHSKPVVVNYSRFTTGSDDDGDNINNEEDTDTNKGYIFVGANDGMLHAFRDATGEEAWAFIPPNLLPNLQYLPDTDHHYYFVDNSPVIYVYDADNDGNIETGDKDMVILICGMRRGGGSSFIPSDNSSLGSYFALNVSDPENPQFLWEINSETTGFSEMGQTWSVPRLAKVNVDNAAKIVAIFGAGYDTVEDLRYGENQNFPADTAGTNTSAASSGEGDVASAGGSSTESTRGRGLFVIEVATLSNGVPILGTTSGDKVWSYTATDNTDMSYSMPSDPLVIDTDSDGYADRVYIGDTGGQLWRFVLEGADKSAWTATRIFEANSSGNGTDVGRKIFYKPTATISGYDTFLYFGTGDREHPLNTAVIDRFYVVRDRFIPNATTEQKTSYNVWNYGTDKPLTESNLVDVTNYSYTDTIRDKLTGPDYTDSATDTTYYGWYIKLNETDHEGEKVLAIPKVFAGTVFFSTYQPASTDPSDDPCVGKLGPARLYAVNAVTGEAVFNFDTSNDTTNSETGEDVEVLARTDRSIGVGDGIASEPLIMINSQGKVSVMVGRGGGFFNTGEIENVDPLFPVYWMKW